MDERLSDFPAPSDKNVSRETVLSGLTSQSDKIDGSQLRPRRHEGTELIGLDEGLLT